MSIKILLFGILALLVISLCVAFQNKEQVHTTTEIISPNESLRLAYEETSQHSALADIAELSCFPSSRFDCNGSSCVASAPATYFLVDYGIETGTYFRCDSNGCDSYPVQVNVSGEFTQFIPLQGQALIFKVRTDNVSSNKGEFIDIATLGTTALISSGMCESVK